MIFFFYIVDSYYRFLDSGGLVCSYYKLIWKAAMLEKVKEFLFILKNKLYIGEVLAKKGWAVSTCCDLYGYNVESISHLLIRYYLSGVSELL